MAQSRSHGGLPHRAFVALAIAQHDEHAPIAPLNAVAEGNAEPDWQTVTERTGRRFHARHAMWAGMLGQHTAVLVVALKNLRIAIAPERQTGVERLRGMTLAQDQAVAVRIVETGRIGVQTAPVGGGKDVDAGERRGQMRGIAAMGQFDDRAPNPPGRVGDRRNTIRLGPGELLRAVHRHGQPVTSIAR